MRAGDKILNYNVTRRIKAGGMGVVFEGEQTWGSRRKVAIKQLLENLRDDEMIRRRFIREAEILEMLDDPRIVKILGFDHEQDAFVMEFIEGNTLSDMLKQDPRAFRQPEVLVGFMTHLLDAFAYAHNVVLTINDRPEKGIVHRDIKPSNIIVQPDMRPKILDFGISRIASFQSTLTDPKMQMGSVPYMSPEQIVSPVDVDWRSDVYSLGVTLWEMLAARSPYPRVTTHEIVVEVQRQIRFEPLPSLLETLPDVQPHEVAFLRRVDEVVAGATAKDREHRYQHCSQMRDDLLEALNNPKPADAPVVVRAQPTRSPEPAHEDATMIITPSARLNSPAVDAPVPVYDGAAAPAEPLRKPKVKTKSKPMAEPEPVAELEPAMVAQTPVTPDGTLQPMADPANVVRNRTVRKSGVPVWIYGVAAAVVLVGGLLWWNASSSATSDDNPTFETSTAPLATEMTMAAMATADSCFEVGNSHYNGLNGTPQDYKQAAYWYMKSAELGNSFAQNLLGYMYQNGQGVETNLPQAITWFEASARQGNAEGQKNLGYMYYLGTGVQKDYPTAMKWFMASAEQGNAESRANLGVMYEEGLGVAIDNKEAMKWYLRAANQGYARAQYYVGTMYVVGKGTEQSQTKAIQWYKLAARQGEANAQTALTQLGQTW